MLEQELDSAVKEVRKYLQDREVSAIFTPLAVLLQ